MAQQQGPVGILTTNADLVVQVWDAALARLTGIPTEQAQGKKLIELVPDLHERQLLTRFQHVLDEGVVEVLAPAFHHFLIRCPPQSPSQRFSEMQQRVTIAPLREEEKIAGVIVTVEDVTERLDRESELSKQLSDSSEKTRLQAAQTLANDEAFEPSKPLIGVLGDESWRVRRAAVYGLARRAAPDAIAALLNSVRENHHNLSLLNSALQVLALSDVDTLTPLIEFLNDEEADLRMQATLALGEQRDERAIPALIGVLSDMDTNVRYHAVEALGKLRAAEATTQLVEITEARDFFLTFPALEALAEIGDPSVAPRLVPLLKEEILCEPAAGALGRLGDEDTVGPLSELLNSPSAPTNAIAQALAMLYDRYEKSYHEGTHIADLARRAINATGAQNLLDALKESEDGSLRALALVLGWLEGPAITRALTHLLGHADARSEVLEALVRQGPRVTELLIEQLSAEDLETRRSAIIALGRIGEKRATQPLVDILETEDELLIQAADALARIGDQSAFEPLLKLVGYPDAAVRQAVVGALNSLGSPEMAERVLLLLTDADPNVRESAVKIAGYFGYLECLDVLLELSRDENESVSRAAIEHLPYFDDDRVITALTTALRSDSSGSRSAAAGALGHVDSPYVIQLLLEALQDSDPWVRYFAARSLGRQCLTDGIEALAFIAEKDEFNHVRIAAMDALGRVGGSRAIEVATRLAGADDADLAGAAVKALGTIDGAAALPPLVKALRSPDANIRRNAVDALGKRTEEDTVDHLQRVAATDPEPIVFATAVEMLRTRGTPKAIGSLISLLADSSRRDVAVTALAHVDEGQTELVAQGLRHNMVEVRRAIIEVLARTKNSRVAEFLAAALRDRDPSVSAAARSALRRSYQPVKVQQ